MSARPRRDLHHPSRISSADSGVVILPDPVAALVFVFAGGCEACLRPEIESTSAKPSWRGRLHARFSKIRLTICPVNLFLSSKWRKIQIWTDRTQLTAHLPHVRSHCILKTTGRSNQRRRPRLITQAVAVNCGIGLRPSHCRECPIIFTHAPWPRSLVGATR